MLVLARARTQQLIIGNDVTITVVDIRHGRVYLGVEAPKELAVDRMEIRRMKEQSRQAANHEGQ